MTSWEPLKRDTVVDVRTPEERAYAAHLNASTGTMPMTPATTRNDLEVTP